MSVEETPASPEELAVPPLEVLNSEPHLDETTGSMVRNVNLRALLPVVGQVVDQITENGVAVDRNLYAATYTMTHAMVSLRNLPMVGAEVPVYEVTFKDYVKEEVPIPPQNPANEDHTPAA